MIEMRKHIRKSLAMMLSLDILIIVVLVFTLSLGFLYWLAVASYCPSGVYRTSLTRARQYRPACKRLYGRD